MRKSVPGITITTDIIVGFPGETKKQFVNSAKLFREMKYDMAFISQYSSRSGTRAAEMKDNISFHHYLGEKKSNISLIK